MPANTPVLFFDIGNTLGAAQVANGALQGIRVFPFVPQILVQLRERCRLGIISNTGNEPLARMQQVMERAGLAGFFDSALILYSSVEKVDKRSIEIFRRAIERSGVAASRCVYISEDDPERELASKAGMQVSYHPLHVFHVLQTMGLIE